MTYQLLGASIPRQTEPAAKSAPAAASAAPATAPRQRWKFKALSSDQRQTIGRIASQAYAAQAERGIIEIPAKGKTAAAEDWRHGQYALVTGHSDLALCDQNHFRDLCRHFRAIIGTPAAAARSFRDAMRTGRVKASGDAGDTHEAREMWRNLITTELETLGYKPGYAWVICKNKFKHRLDSAPADILEKTLYQIRSNAQAKRKAGSAPQPSADPTAPARKRLHIIKPGDPDDMPEVPF